MRRRARAASLALALHGVAGAVSAQEQSALEVKKGCTPMASGTISYPRLSLESTERGVVLARMVFASRDAAPQVEILVGDRTPRLASAVREYAASYRLTCDGDAVFPISARQMFRFVMPDEDGAVRIKDTNLTGLLSIVHDLPGQKVRFDLDTMECPFAVTFRPWRPYLANEVSEVGSPVPARAPFLDWLRTVRLDLPDRQHRQILGSRIGVQIPCAVLNLL